MHANPAPGGERSEQPLRPSGQRLALAQQALDARFTTFQCTELAGLSLAKLPKALGAEPRAFLA